MACWYPIHVKKNGVDHMVPCGSSYGLCIPCLKAKAAAWTVRLMFHQAYCYNAKFITLTYDDEKIPYEDSCQVLKQSDLQSHFKTYRRRIDKRYGQRIRITEEENSPGKRSKFKTVIPERYKLKYYAIGEYGSKTKRPHYHIIAFNVDEELFLETWNKGRIKHSGTVTKQSVNYVTHYVINKAKYQDRLKYPPFAIISNGMGKDYLTEDRIKYHKERFDTMIILPGGEIYAMPRYIKEKIWNCETALKILGLKNKKNATEKTGSIEYKDHINVRNYNREKVKRLEKFKI